MSGLGQYQKKITSSPTQLCYVYDSGNISFLTDTKNGTELPSTISVMDKRIETARNVGIGSLMGEINNAYSDCRRDSFTMNGDYGITVFFDTFKIFFYFDYQTDIVTNFSYEKNSPTSVASNATSAPATNNAAPAPNNAAPAPNNATPAPAPNNAAPATNNATPAPAPNTAQTNAGIAEYEIMYNGKKLSILDNASTIMSSIGQYEKKDVSTVDEPRYIFDSGNIDFYTFVTGGQELTYDLCIYKKGAKTARNIGVGDSREMVMKAYGEPTEVYRFDQGYGFKYKFDNFTLYFDFFSNTNTVIDVVFGNNATIATRHAIHTDYIGD